MKQISYKRHLIILLSIFIAPIVLCLIFYNYYSIKALKNQVIRRGQDAINLYQSQLEYDLSQLSLTVADDWANDFDHINMMHEVDELTRHLSSYEIGVKHRALLSKNTELGAIALISEKNDLKRYMYQEGRYDYDLHMEMMALGDEMLSHAKEHTKSDWQPYQIGGEAFLCRILGYNGGYTILYVDLNQTVQGQVLNSDAGDGFLYFTGSEKEDLTPRDGINNEELPDPFQEKLVATGEESEKYLVVSHPSEDLHINIYYFLPYNGYFSYMDTIEIFLLLLSILLILLIPVGYFLISRSYFKPMSRLMETMEVIRKGNLDVKVEGNYRIREFNEFNDTFNQMMTEIKTLKIKFWERELQKNRAELQYLQLQLKPHFFLNCLKNLYGLAQLKRYDKLQNMILQISDYLRYHFKDNLEPVSLNEELLCVKNYVALQRDGMGQNVDCELEVEDSLQDCIVPVMILQPFVENAFKYGRIPNQTLQVSVRIVELMSEEGNLLDIIIEDNGKGFDEEVLSQLNEQSPGQFSDQNIGIANIRQRLYLIYGEAAVLQCSNLEAGHGGRCEMIFPKEMPKGQQKGTEE
jgi:two-component system sensor histidine kinase YesM